MLKPSAEKILSRDDLVPIVSNLHSMKGKAGFTSGVFDLLHAGHLDYLEKARAECDMLIVGVNSDASVKQNKGPARPVCGERDRATLIAGLACVDYVFIFNESNNNANIQLLKPAIYFKAGDYSKDKLSSAALVEAYGGSVRLLQFKQGYSTTSTIERVCELFGNVGTAGSEAAVPDKKPAVFLDRDGTIVELIDYLHEPQKMKLLPGVAAALKSFMQRGYRLVVVTNQPGIGMGYFSKEDLFAVNKAMLAALSAEGIVIDKIYFCPHSKAEQCRCRKPNTGMIERAVKELNLDLGRCVVIGDSTGDILLAHNVGCQSVLVATGTGGKDGLYDVSADYSVADLLQASQLKLANR